jgi:DNA-binding LytR/AlgR family response regulator
LLRARQLGSQTIVTWLSIAEIEPLGSGGAMARLQGGATIEISRRYRSVLRDKLGWQAYLSL